MIHHIPTLRENLDRLTNFISQESVVLKLILVYATTVGLFSLIIPFTVQELVNTFAFAVTPIMVVTLVGIMAGTLFFVAIFRVLQFFATDILERRIFIRITLALAKVLPLFKDEVFRSHNISRFFETVFLQRALSNLLVDLVNVLVGGFIGMVLLAWYHPYFIIFDALLIIGIVIIALLGKGGFKSTLNMSEAKYDTFNWFQEVADNLLHFQAANCSDLIIQKADTLGTAYVKARKSRFRSLLRQYMGSITFQVIVHTGLLGTAGWLLSQGELTLGQLVAAEVIIASLLLNLESVVKRTYIVFYFFTSLTELDHLFAIPKHKKENKSGLKIPQLSPNGIHLKYSNLAWATENESAFKNIALDALPGEKLALVCLEESIRRRISLVLGGLEQPPAGIVSYNEADIKNLSADEIASHRSLFFGGDLTLFEGSILENITMGRPNIGSNDLLWALNLTELDIILEAFPEGLDTQVHDGGKDFTSSQKVRILLARAIITRPALLILDGALPEIPLHIRDTLLNRLAGESCNWTLVIVTTNPNAIEYTEKHQFLYDPSFK